MNPFIIVVSALAALLAGSSYGEQMKTNADSNQCKPASIQEQVIYEWKNITMNAPFAPRDGLGVLSFNGRMWVIGGWNTGDQVHFPRNCSNDVWSSADGLHWKLEKPNTFTTTSFDPNSDWEGRHCAGYAVYNGKMWIIGGDTNQGHYMYDIWNSGDGRIWTHVNKDKPVPWGPRALFHTVVFKDKIWIMGGQTMPQSAPAQEFFYDDIWCTSDCVNWQKVNRPASWSPRGLIGGNVVLNKQIWILGGGTYWTPQHRDDILFNDVWSSADGINWKVLTSHAPWMKRKYHDVAAFDGRMWVLEGHSGNGGKNLKDVWYSADGVNWTELRNTPWAPRHAAGALVHDNALWMIAGNNMQSDVWKLAKK